MDSKFSDLEQQLMENSQTQPDNTDYDLGFVFKILEKEKEESLKNKEVLKMKRDIFKSQREKVTLLQKLQQQKQKNKQKLYEKLREEVYQTLVNKCKLNVIRVQQDQHILFKISASEEVLEKEASRVSYRLRMKKEIDDEMARDCPPYAKVDTNIWMQKGKKELFESYEGGRTLFRQVDRIRLIGTIIGRHVVVSQAQRHQLFVCVIPKNSVIEKKLAESMICLNPFVKLPIEEIRNYFGEQVALYFYWVDHFYKWLTIPTFLGFLATIFIGYFEGLPIYDVQIIIEWMSDERKQQIINDRRNANITALLFSSFVII